MASATELKQRGNEAYSAKRFEEALKLYEEGLTMDGENIDLLNNAAAANFALEKYDAAITCARRSLGVRDNFKAHKRLGEVFWKKGEIAAAAAEYQKALELEPADSSTRTSLQQLKEQLQRGQQQQHREAGPVRGVVPHSVTSGKVGLLADSIALGLSCATLVCILLALPHAQAAWSCLLLFSVVRQCIIAHHMGFIVPQRSVIKTWFDNRSTLDLILYAVALVSGVSAQLPLVFAQGIYSALSFSSNFSELQAIAPVLYQKCLPYVQQISSRTPSLIMNAATSEAVMFLTVMFSGGAIFTLFYIQYTKNLYRIDSNMRLAFYGIRENLTQLARKPFMPALADVWLQKVCDVLYRFSQQPY